VSNSNHEDEEIGSISLIVKRKRAFSGRKGRKERCSLRKACDLSKRGGYFRGPL